MPIILSENYRNSLTWIKTVPSIEPNFKNVLNIVIINIMPQAEQYERNIINAFSAFNNYNIRPIWVYLQSHSYNSSNKEHLSIHYNYWNEVIKEIQPHGVIVTGAPVEHLNYHDIKYWSELEEIFYYTQKNSIPVMGLCWAGLAIGQLLGVSQTIQSKKLFGNFKSEYLNAQISKNKTFFCPQSRHALIEDACMINASEEGKLKLLAYAIEAGFFIFESIDGLWLAHCGHPEYHKQRLAFEYLRDKELGRSDVSYPANFDVHNPANTWKQHRYDFFKYWLQKVSNQNKQKKL